MRASTTAFSTKHVSHTDISNLQRNKKKLFFSFFRMQRTTLVRLAICIIHYKRDYSIAEPCWNGFKNSLFGCFSLSKLFIFIAASVHFTTDMHAFILHFFPPKQQQHKECRKQAASSKYELLCTFIPFAIRITWLHFHFKHFFFVFYFSFSPRF